MQVNQPRNVSTPPAPPAPATPPAGASDPATAKPPRKPKKPAAPPGPGLKVAAFVDLMRKIEPMSASLSGEQVQFVQLCVQRFEHDQKGVVKTKLTLPKPKKEKPGRRPAPSTLSAAAPVSARTDAFLDRLTSAPNEDEVMEVIAALPDATAQELAAAQGLRSTTPAQAREKLFETVITLRQMARIQNAGKPPPKLP